MEQMPKAVLNTKKGERMKSFAKLIWVVILNLILIPSIWAANNDVKESVVKIYSNSNLYDYDEPWKMLGQERGSGSGCIISEKRILTNAHVIANQTFIQVRRAGQAKKYIAEVEIVAHECDLAILKVNDDSFFSGVEPVEIGELPKFRDKVVVYGFPEGGDKLCITEGVVSRIEHSTYSHSGATLLSCQIDAAINAGSSGGPVINNDKIVGVAFEGMSGEDIENIGYMVPAPIIKHFIKDIEDGKYDGIPGLGISWQKLENPDIRYKFGMTEKQTGVLVNTIYPDSPTREALKSEDIILSIDGNNIENDGTITFRKGERTSFAYLIQKKYINDTAEFQILRENKIVNIEIKLSSPVNFGRLVPHEQYDVAPAYYILGGLVFEPLTLNYLKVWGDESWVTNAPTALLNFYFHGKPTDDRKEVIILVKVLADKINVGYQDWRYEVISYVNGKKISTMKDLVNAFEKQEGKYHTIVDEQGHKIVLDKSKVDENSRKILERYIINSDRSKDL